MKANIHPKWYNNAKVTCTCGNTFTTGSTQPAIDIDICSNCHPYFTGEMKFVDRQGRVDKFKKKMEQAEKLRAIKEKELAEKLSQQTNQKETEEKSYQDILREKQAALRQSDKKKEVQTSQE